MVRKKCKEREMKPLGTVMFPILMAWVLAVTGSRADAKTVRLLTIGNSFSQNATRYLSDLAKAGGHELIHKPLVIAGAPLELHATMARKHAQDPLDKAGLYSTGRGLQEELQADKWDFVTIQQASILSHDLATYRPYARRLYDIIRTNAPQAEVVMHETWTYRCDDPRFAAKAPKPGEPATQEAMYRGLTNAYRTIAGQLGVRLLPVGEAFYLADTDPKWGYRPDPEFNPKTAQSPALPDQAHSLNMGWRWDGKKLNFDGHHANVAGQYLGACVFYEVMFGESVVGNGFNPKRLDPDYARFLQETAHRAVLESRGGT